MRLLLAVAAAVLPIPHSAVLGIDRHMTGRNFLPTRMLHGFVYRSSTARAGTLRVRFANAAGQTIEWRVQPMKGDCAAGNERSFQLGGNKVWWARRAGEQLAWRCAFDQAGKPVRLVAASATPPTKLAAVGLGTVVAHSKRY